MRKTVQALALAAGVVAAAGCGDKFITEVPVDFVAPENFYQTQTDALASVNAAYATFINQPLGTASYVGRNMFMLVDYPTEVLTSRLSATNERSLIGNYNPQFSSSHPYVETVYQAAYAGINRANTTIARVPAIPMDTLRRGQIVGEAKFLRALHYYYLAGLFGGVPLKLEETSSISAPPLPRATAAETWAQIEKDLTEAAAVLPPSWGGSDFGRATKGAALTLLAKAYMQSAATVPSLSGDYAKAVTTLRQVQTLGYSLDPKYRSLFDGSNERSPEIIFSLQNIRLTGAGGYMSQWDAPMTSPAIYQPGAQNQYQAERPFYDSYSATDTARKNGTWLTSFVKANGDTIKWTWTSGIESSAKYGSTGPVPRKYLDLGASDNGAEAPDFIVLRYADVLLGLAESINASAGPTAEAYAAINAVRARAGVPNLTAGLATDAFRDSVFLERRYEFAVEMHGMFDSRRDWTWAKGRVEANMAIIKASNVKPFTSSVEKADNRPIGDKWKLYPIPVHACELNHTLTQNPGWDDGICLSSTGG